MSTIETFEHLFWPQWEFIVLVQMSQWWLQRCTFFPYQRPSGVYELQIPKHTRRRVGHFWGVEGTYEDSKTMGVLFCGISFLWYLSSAVKTTLDGRNLYIQHKYTCHHGTGGRLHLLPGLSKVSPWKQLLSNLFGDRTLDNIIFQKQSLWGLVRNKGL